MRQTGMDHVFRCLFQESLPLWRLVIQWSVLNAPEQTEQLFEVSHLPIRPSICQSVRPSVNQFVHVSISQSVCRSADTSQSITSDIN